MTGIAVTAFNEILTIKQVARLGSNCYLCAVLISTISDDICVSYANTLSWRGSEMPVEKLHDLDDLLDWIEQSAAVDASAVEALTDQARQHPETTAGVFGQAIVLREVIYRAFSAVAAGERVRDQDFVALKRALAEAPARGRLERMGDSYAWRIKQLRLSAPEVLVPVLWSAGDLLLNARQRRIRRCANERCLWLFLDESKSGTRRWCDMASCGNRAKARRHYSKVKLH